MIHPQEVSPSGGFVKGRCAGEPGQGGSGTPRTLALGLLLALAAAAAGCEEGTTVPTDPRFGQVGEIRVEVETPLQHDGGVLHEALVWRSDGLWILVERISYRASFGGQAIRRSRANPGELAPDYASLLQQLRETPGLRLLNGGAPQELNPVCEPPSSRVTFTIQDDHRGESAMWRRCADGSLFVFTPGGAGPDPEAARVVTAAQLTRSLTIGEEAGSSYEGSVPFGTVAQGSDSPAAPEGPEAFLSATGAAPAAFLEFWEAHQGEGMAPPSVNWHEEMVLLVAVGRRLEAGGAMEVRRVLELEGSTRVEPVEQVPGDFCSPGKKEGHPFHLVILPRTQAPIFFEEPALERIPCGIQT